MSIRLELATSGGGLALPEAGSVCILHPTADADLSLFDKALTTIVTPSKPIFDRFTAQGWRCTSQMPDAADLAYITAPRFKDLARDLIARASDITAATCGTVVVDGDKTNGIDSLLKAVKKSAQISGPVNKAHGKLFWFTGARDLFADWHAIPRDIGGFTTRAGVFSADSVDSASKLLIDALPDGIKGSVADLGAGWGYLTAQVLAKNPDITAMHMIEADQTALECAAQNVADPRAKSHWADATTWTAPAPLNAVIMNPPFHTGRAADPDLGRGFIVTAAKSLSGSGHLWMVANRHLPYEDTLNSCFQSVEEIAGDNRFKIMHASRPTTRKSGR